MNDSTAVAPSGAEDIQPPFSPEQIRRHHHANRLYAVLSAVNRTIIRKLGRDELLPEICRILVEIGKFRLARFGVPDVEGWLNIEASCGDIPSFLDEVRISVRDIPEGHGPTGIAIREGRPVIINTIDACDSMLPWRDQINRSGIKSSGCFPVRLPSGELGGLSLYSTEYDFFSHEEEELLSEISADIGYALEFSTMEERRTQAEEQLAHTQALARIGGWSVDLTTGLCTNSPEASRITGMPTTAVPLDAFLSIIHPDDSLRLQQAMERTLLTAAPYDLEHRLVVDGVTKWVHGMAEIKHDDSGRPIQVFGMLQDISERKQARDALDASRERFRVIFDSAVEGIVVNDLQEHSFVMVNPAMCALFGYDEAEFLRLSVADLHPPESLREVQADFAALCSGGERSSIDIPCCRRNGDLFYVRQTAKYNTSITGVELLYGRT